MKLADQGIDTNLAKRARQLSNTARNLTPKINITATTARPSGGPSLERNTMTTKHPPKQSKPLRKPVLGDEGVYGDGPAYREAMKNWLRRDNPNVEERVEHLRNAVWKPKQP